MHRRTFFRGFTLIELLVVIAIIAILAAILFPVFAQARAKARQTSSLSNLKNINMAFQMYAQDYDERFPYWNWWYSSQQGGCPRADLPAACEQYGSLWINSLQPYIKNAQIYADPSDRGNLSVKNSSLYWWTPDGQTDAQLIAKGFNPTLLNQKLSYGMSEYVSNDTNGFNGMAAMDRPAQTLLVAESITSFACCYSARPDRGNINDPLHKYILRRVAYANQCDGTWAADGPTHQAAWEGNNCTRHNGGENIGYADGHVKWSKAPQITWDLFHGDQAN